MANWGILSGLDAATPTPQNLVVSAAVADTVTLVWSAALDESTILGYRVYQDGVLMATLPVTGGPYSAGLSGFVAETSTLLVVVTYDDNGEYGYAALSYYYGGGSSSTSTATSTAVTANVYAQKGKSIVVRIRHGNKWWTGAAWSGSADSAQTTALTEILISSNQYESLYYGTITAPAGAHTLEYIDTSTGLTIAQEAIGTATTTALSSTVASSATAICNLALARIGVSQPLDDVTTDTTMSGIMCRAFYAEALNRVLGSGVWAFATKQAQLIAEGSAAYGWSYRYQYPSDCLQAVEVAPDILPSWSGYRGTIYGITYEWEPQGYSFEVVSNELGTGLSIMCNLPTAYLRYVSAVTDPALFPAPFRSAVAWALAVEIASPLSAAPAMAERAEKAYQAILNDAMANSMNEAQPRQRLNSFVAARL